MLRRSRLVTRVLSELLSEPSAIPGRCRHASSFQVFYARNGDPNTVVEGRTVDLTDSLREREVRLKWLAAPLNPADINMIQGNYAIKPKLPAVLGNEGVAEVEEVGAGVSQLRRGQRVMPSRADIGGTWQQRAVVDAGSLMPVAEDIPLAAAATLLVNPPTAYRMLKDFVDLKEGDLIVQNGATSAVGRYVIQLAKEWGIKTVNLVRDVDRDQEGLRSLGADYVLGYKEFPKAMRRLTKEHGEAKLALNCVGGDSVLFMAASLGTRGKLVTYGAMSKMPLQVPTGPLIFKQIELHGYWMSRWYLQRAETADGIRQRDTMIADICRLIHSQKLVTPPCETRPLAEFKAAIARATGDGPTVKQLVTMNS